MKFTALAPKALVFLLALGIAGVSLYSLVDPAKQSPVFRSMLIEIPWAGYSHIVFGSLALILGGLQLSSRLRRRNLRLHERIGKVYVFCVLVGAVGAIVSNIASPTTWPAKSAFWVQAILWPVVTAAGYPRGVPFDPKRHGRLMLWSYAMTCAAITLRLILIPSLMFGVRFSVVYPISAWGSFIINLTLLEAVLWVGRVRKRRAMQAVEPAVRTA